jgi:ribosome biogenesis GTPase / thiamine phosphate phosphatase
LSEGWDALLPWGLGPFRKAFQPHEAAGLQPARVTALHRGAVDAVSPAGEVRAMLAGKLWREVAASPGAAPAVGDAVALARAGDGSATVEAVLPRRTAFVRKAAGRASAEQVLAANVDVVFVAEAAGADPHARRLERYLAAAWESGATPVVLVTKLDLAEDPAEALAAAAEVALGADVVGLSAATGQGLDALDGWLVAGRTVVLVGASGAGKSTLVNRWLGEARQATGGLDATGRGRHTTSRRELLRLPSGALVIDTPGLRELGLWDAEGGLAGAFPEIAALAVHCRFSDCTHETEPECAVLAAVEAGGLPEERLLAHGKLAAEGRALAARREAGARGEARRHAQAMERSLRQALRLKGREGT